MDVVKVTGKPLPRFIPAKCYTPIQTFLLNEQPSVRRARPPVGWQSTVLHEAHRTTVCACNSVSNRAHTHLIASLFSVSGATSLRLSSWTGGLQQRGPSGGGRERKDERGRRWW